MHDDKLRLRAKLSTNWLGFSKSKSGVAVCPICHMEMEVLEVTKNYLPEHWRCPESQIVFYGDVDGLAVCQNVDLDIKFEKREETTHESF